MLLRPLTHHLSALGEKPRAVPCGDYNIVLGLIECVPVPYMRQRDKTLLQASIIHQQMIDHALLFVNCAVELASGQPLDLRKKK